MDHNAVSPCGSFVDNPTAPMASQDKTASLQLPPAKKKRRTKSMPFASRRNPVLAPIKNYTRLYASLHANDILLEHCMGGSHLKMPRTGNQRYLAILRQHQEEFSQAVEMDQQRVVERVYAVATQLQGAARFIARRFGQQWVEEDQARVLEMIRNDLHHCVLEQQKRIEVAKAREEAEAAREEMEVLLAIEREEEAKAREAYRKTQINKGTPKTNSSSKKKRTREESAGQKAFFLTPEAAALAKTSNLLSHPSLQKARESLSDYNRLLLDNLVLVQADGKGKRVLGQVGFRCSHCEAANQPTNRGCFSFPGRPEVSEYNAYLIGNKHLLGNEPNAKCPNMPQAQRQELERARNQSRKVGNGIQHFLNEFATNFVALKNDTVEHISTPVSAFSSATEESPVSSALTTAPKSSVLKDITKQVASSKNKKSLTPLVDTSADLVQKRVHFNGDSSVQKKKAKEPPAQKYKTSASLESSFDDNGWKQGADGGVSSGMNVPSMAEERSKLSDCNSIALDHLELFCATEEDVSVLSGRASSKNVVVGQVGIRCRHCSLANERTSSCATFPGKLEILYYGIHHLVKTHFLHEDKTCPHLPKKTRGMLKKARKTSRSQSTAPGATKIDVYAAEAARRLGVEELEGGGLWLPMTTTNSV